MDVWNDLGKQGVVMYFIIFAFFSVLTWSVVTIYSLMKGYTYLFDFAVIIWGFLLVGQIYSAHLIWGRRGRVP